MYYEMSFARADTSWMYLSERLRNEIGSVDQWAEQQDIYTFTYMEFVSMPEASISGDEAEISFKVRLDHTWGSEIVTGTWVCVVEGGEWKLDRLERFS
jgi:serine/threonine-protein kinase